MRHKLPEEKKKKSFSLTLDEELLNIFGRKDLCEFISITLHKYKKEFGSFETKLFNNFSIQKKQIN